MWLSAAGPWIFDGSTPEPIEGVEDFFNQNHEDYVGADNIEDAFAWYDTNYKEWNLRVGDLWLVYDLLKRKWDADAESYWEDPEDQPEDLESYFRRF